MLPAADCKVLQRDLLGCAPVAPARVRPPARSVSLVLPVTSDPSAAGRGGAALAPGGRRLLQRDPGAGPGAARAAGRCESGRGGAGTRRLHRGRVAPQSPLPPWNTRAGGRADGGIPGGLGAEMPGAGDEDTLLRPFDSFMGV